MARYLATVLMLCLLSGCSAKKAAGQNHQRPVISDPWATLIPADGLELVRKETNDDAFSAEYSGCTTDQLLARVDRALVGASYRQTCTQFEGRVRGYTRGPERLLVKVDSFGSVQALSVGNERGSDRLLYGVCFKGYDLGPAERVK